MQWEPISGRLDLWLIHQAYSGSRAVDDDWAMVMR